MVHVTAAPALVAVIVAGVVARAGVSDGHDDGGLLVEASAVAVERGAIPVLCAVQSTAGVMEHRAGG